MHGVRPFVWSGRLFINLHDLIRAGHRDRLNAGDLIELQWVPVIGGEPVRQLYEVHGFRQSTRDYWVRRMELDPGSVQWGAGGVE